MTDNYYGVTSTDDVQYEQQGLPVGIYTVHIKDEEPDAKGRGVVVNYEVLDGEKKGKTGKVWYLTMHENPQTRNIAQQNLKRIADATGTPVSPLTPLKGRTLVLEVGVQKNDPTRTDIKKYHPEGYKVDEAPF